VTRARKRLALRWAFRGPLACYAIPPASVADFHATRAQGHSCVQRTTKPVRCEGCESTATPTSYLSLAMMASNLFNWPTSLPSSSVCATSRSPKPGQEVTTSHFCTHPFSLAGLPSPARGRLFVHRKRRLVRGGALVHDDAKPSRVREAPDF
jgi:hypothetical protein